MFNFIHAKKWVAQIILGLIIITFAVFGIDSYFRDSESTNAVAKVGDQKITQQQFSKALQEHQQRLMNLFGNKVDTKLLESLEMRVSVVEGMIRQRMISMEAFRNNLSVTDEQLRDKIGNNPAFAVDGKFSFSNYQAFLRNMNMNEIGFEKLLRQDLMQDQLQAAYTETAFIPTSLVQRLIHIKDQKREISEVDFVPENYLSQVKLEPAAIKDYYENNRREFEIPEKVRVDYVVLSPEKLIAETKVDSKEIEGYYAEHKQRFQTAEERRASHILIGLKAGATNEEKANAQRRAQEIYTQVKKSPQQFAALAKAHSEDPGSATNGGDLGYFGRGVMVPPFEEAVFNMKEGEITGPVESEAGFHIIKLEAIRAAKGATLNEIRPQIESEVRKQKALKKFAETAETFSNLVADQMDSLTPAAQALNLPVQRSDWITKTGNKNPLFNNEKVLQAIFSEDVKANKHNTEVIEVAPDTLIAARIAEYQPAAVQPLSQVSAVIEKKLLQREASKLAVQDGKAKLAALRKGEQLQLNWSAPKVVARENMQSSEDVQTTIFKASVERLPSYTGSELPAGGYKLIKVIQVLPSQAINPQQMTSASDQLKQIIAQEQFAAYLSSLRKKYKVEIYTDKLKKSE